MGRLAAVRWLGGGSKEDLARYRSIFRVRYISAHPLFTFKLEFPSLLLLPLLVQPRIGGNSLDIFRECNNCNNMAAQTEPKCTEVHLQLQLEPDTLSLGSKCRLDE